MEERVRKGIILFLKELIAAVRKSDSFRLKELSNANVKHEIAFRDEDSLTISVVAYALSKTIRSTRRKATIALQLRSALVALNSGDERKYRIIIKSLIKGIEAEDSGFRQFVSGVFERAKIKKGCSLCESGTSMARAADMLNVSKWELAGYLGRSRAAGRHSERVTAEQRLALARRLFA